MRVLYFDCFSGISGDMFLSTLVDLGVSEEVIQKGIASLGLPGLRMEFGKTNKNGIDARTFHATVFGEDADTYGRDHKHDHGHAHSHNHGHDHHHEHEHDHHHHHGHGRTFRDIQGIIENSDLTQKAKNMAIEIFRVIAVAEGKIHGATPEEVHFHEVGAYDSIADIVGAAVGIDYLNPDRIEFSPLPMTRGFVKCNHGVMPLPAPATAEIVKDLPIIWEEFRFEMVTPTGAGIAKVLGAGFGTPPKGALLKTGYGAGKKTYERPNVVRGMLFQVENGEGSSSGACSNDKTPTDILEIEMNIDDMTGETMGYVLEKALAMGALDSWSQPIFMKKGRPAYKLSFLIKEADLEKFTEFLLRETSSFGFRYSEKRRVVLERSFRKVESVFGDVTLKEGRLKGEIVKRSLEYEDCKRIAMEEGLPLIHVLDRIEKEI